MSDPQLTGKKITHPIRGNVAMLRRMIADLTEPLVSMLDGAPPGDMVAVQGSAKALNGNVLVLEVRAGVRPAPRVAAHA